MADDFKIETLAIGDELLDGRVSDGNAAWLASQLSAVGLSLSRMGVVGDDQEAIAAALTEATSRADVVVCSGGLGPTDDDLTRQAAARWLGVELEHSEEALSKIQERYATSGRTMAPNNRSQALFPAGAEIHWNDVGTAPAFSGGSGQGRAFFLPGVPHEYRWLVQHRVTPALGLDSAPIARRRLVFFGLGESELEHRIGPLELPEGATVGYRPHFPEIELTLTARGQDPEAEVEQIAAAILARAGDKLIAEGDQTLASRLGERLLEAGQRVTTAESCTGGMISGLITSVPGSSGWFDEAYVTYSNDAKVRLIGVAQQTLEAVGAVSQRTVEEMAEGARSRAGADWGLAVSGVAGPGGGSPDKPVGTVWVGLAAEGDCQSRKLTLPERWGRTRIREATAHYALAWLLRRLEGR